MVDNIFIPYRLEGETFEAYKSRQKLVKLAQKSVKRGTLVWDSYAKGQYRNGGSL